MASTLQISSSKLPDGLAVTLVGEIDLARSPELRLRLRDDVDAGPKRLVIDLTKVTYMDSSGVATLVEALQRSKARGCRLVLAGLQPKVRSIFSISRLDTVFEISATLDEAKAK